MGKKHVSCWARGIKRGGKTLKSWQTFKFAQMFCNNYEQEGLVIPKVFLAVTLLETGGGCEG